MTILGLIPARGGSKGVPGKNIRPLGGRPLIAWTIDAARHVGAIDRLIVSTDCEEIAAIARAEGAEVPFLRPADLASDTAGSLGVALHALDAMATEGFIPDALMLLQPTTPLRRAQDIADCVSLFERRADIDAVVSLTPVPVHHNAHWQFELSEDQRLSAADGSPLSRVIPRRQDLPATYIRNGAIYLTQCDSLRINQSFFGSRCAGHVMPAERSINIDTEADFAAAEAALQARGTP